jgi:hypothetical protein
MLIAALALATPLDDLAVLEVRPRAPHAGYSRERFGRRWADIDRNRCDTRNDILARDLDEVRRDGSCVVLDGVLDDPYTGEVVVFERGPRSAAVQIDHVVPLSLAWDTGAQLLSPREREAFANDPLNLLAVEGRANQSKGDSDASEWMPPARSAWCSYAARVVAVRVRYRLWVTPEERDALVEALTDCE